MADRVPIFGQRKVSGLLGNFQFLLLQIVYCAMEDGRIPPLTKSIILVIKKLQ